MAAPNSSTRLVSQPLRIILNYNFFSNLSLLIPDFFIHLLLLTLTITMDPTLQAVVAAAASFFIVSFLFTLMYLICQRLSTRHHPRTRIRTQPQPTSNSLSESFDPSLDRISMSELLLATKNFSPDGIIGDGSFGLVYKARLSNGATVAVKKLSKDAFQGFREFTAEMETLGKKQIRHPNLVRILGYCVSGDDRVLIYEFIEKGSLDQWLHDASSLHSHRDNNSTSVHLSRCESGSKSKSGSNIPLKWDIRVKIINGVAKGLLFLHTLDTPIIHRDIKASNVLLDSEFEAHIADFGLARRIELWHSHVSTQVAGTMGYMPPEYRNGVMAASVKGDVYSFGVLMIELATGRRPNWPIRMEEDGKEIGLVEWAVKMVEQGRIIEMVDSSVSREYLRESQVGEYMRIACLCTNDRPKDRPFMGEVVTLLNQLSL